MGREHELAHLHSLLQKARTGQRQLVFVTGEPGIGKTAIIEAFLSEVRSSQSASAAHVQSSASGRWVAWGQCIEHHGAGEAFLPVLDAFGRLCCGPESERVVAVLRQYAPMWLVQMPFLLAPDEYESLQRKVHGASRERMLRECAVALEALTTESPFVFVLEDLHWSDGSTLDLLSFIARRKEAVRLLILGTYRPVEMLHNGHPLKAITQELYAHEQATELSLGVLDEVAIAHYLTTRLHVASSWQVEGQGEGSELARQRHLTRMLHQRTGGNPLFLVSLVNELMERGMFIQTATGYELRDDATIENAIPDSIRHLVARQSERLSAEDQHMLQAASVAGMEFSAAAVASALALDTAIIERQCEQLVHHHQFLKRMGIEEWPDGTLAARYGFLHALYQQLWHERVTPTQLQQIHARIGERKEIAYGPQAIAHAAELALHFEQARIYAKAVQYHGLAGQQALQRSAPQEALEHLTTGVELLQRLPAMPERDQLELPVQIALGMAFIFTKGYAAPEVGATYMRAQALCQQAKDSPQLFSALMGIVIFHSTRANSQKASEVATHCLALAQRLHDPSLLVEAHTILSQLEHNAGSFIAARTHIEQALTLCDDRALRPSLHVHDPKIYCLTILTHVLWCLGYLEQARAKSREAITTAEGLGHTFTLVSALGNAAMFHQHRREEQQMAERLQVMLKLADDYEFALWGAFGGILQGWMHARQEPGEESIMQIHHGIEIMQSIGAVLLRPYQLALLAEAYGMNNQPQEAIAILSEALTLVHQTREHFHEAELYRLKGEFTLQQESQERGAGSREQKSENLNPRARSIDPQGEAEACFLKAIEIAQKQHAKSWELRAATSLARLWQQQAARQSAKSKEVRAENTEEGTRDTQHESRTKLAEAHQMLSEIYNWFTEGFDTKDLQEAKALLEELSH